MHLSFGFFIFDLVWVLWYTPGEHVMLAHHLTTISGYLASLVSGTCGTEVLATVCLRASVPCGDDVIAQMSGAEVTNPLLQVRWFMRETGVYTGLAGLSVDLAFLVLFTAARLGLGSALLLHTFKEGRTHPFLQVRRDAMRSAFH